MEKESKFFGLLKLSAEEREKKFEEADLLDEYENRKDQARADIRKGVAEVRRLNTALRAMEKGPSSFRLGALADQRLQLKCENEKIDEMKKLFTEYFDEEFTK